MKRTLIIIFSVIVCLAVGFIASRFQTDAINNWYPLLNKPPLTPPNIVFPIVWNILYVFMGLSIGYILSRRNPHEMLLLRLFGIQLLLNFLWSITFFYMQNPLLGLIDIVLLDIVVVLYLVNAYKKANKFSFALFVPYLIWILFATYLNLYILINN